MPRPSNKPASVERAGETLRFAGALTRAGVAALWRETLPQVAGARTFDLAQVPRVDSAGIALLAELAARCGAPVEVTGAPQEYEALRTAYRLTPTLDFAR
jgi:phospholipid transport system transporter-binding protein